MIPITTVAFLPHDAMLAWHMLSSCVCRSVRLSHAGIVPKWLNIGSQEQRIMIAHRLVF